MYSAIALEKSIIKVCSMPSAARCIPYFSALLSLYVASSLHPTRLAHELSTSHVMSNSFWKFNPVKGLDSCLQLTAQAPQPSGCLYSASCISPQTLPPALPHGLWYIFVCSMSPLPERMACLCRAVMLETSRTSSLQNKALADLEQPAKDVSLAARMPMNLSIMASFPASADMANQDLQQCCCKRCEQVE